MTRLGMMIAAGGGAVYSKMAMQTSPVLAGAGPHDVYPAPDGTVWFTAQSAGKLGRLDPRTGRSDLIALGPGAAPHDVIVGPDGAAQYIAETQGLIAATPTGMKVAGEVPPAPSTPAERLALWCARLPSPAPEMLRALAGRGERYMDTAELASALGKKPSGGHWNSGIAVLRNNALIETDGRRYRSAALFRE